MKKFAVVVVLLCLVSVALAAEAPKVTSPKNGDKIGPNVDVVGTTVGKRFVIIITDVYLKGKEKPLKSVPGHRSWTDDEGNFKLRIATPRVRNAKGSDLIYKIRVFSARPGEEKSPETVITCTAK